MNFEKFTKVGGSFAPMISIRKGGVFGFSQGALNRFKLADGDWYLVLFFDREAQIIGMQPTQDRDAEGAIKLQKRVIAGADQKTSVTSSLSAKAFFDYYAIPKDETKTYKAEWDSGNTMILIKLKEAQPVAEPQ